jgi:hypothetical protein
MIYTLNCCQISVSLQGERTTQGMKSAFYNQFALAGILCFCFCANSVRANVYATDIRLNGSMNAGVVVPGRNLTISYILNDTATGGVWIRVYSGATLIQTLTSAAEQAGTNAGLNTVIWDTPSNLAEGVYTVSITAASIGYETWTNITDDGPNFFAYGPRGISVDQNTNSPYYGRVYVANAYADGGNAPGDQIGIIKCNADGSQADEGGFSTGGWNWQGGGYSPWKMTIGADDRLYVDDFADQGVVASFDPVVDNDGVRTVLCSGNYPTQDPSANLSGLVLTGSGDNTALWMTDENPFVSAGIVSWEIGTNGVAANGDQGTVIVPLDSDYLTEAPYDLAVNSNGFIYTVQFIRPWDEPSSELLVFPPYSGEPETTPDWSIEWYPTLVDTLGVAVSPLTNYVAIAVQGVADDPEYDTTGGLYLYNSTDLAFIADLDTTGGDAYYDLAWDKAGNLYAVDDTVGVWRVYSPPGTNQATTVAVPFIQSYSAILSPTLANPVASPGMLQFVLEGQSNVTYSIQCSSDLINWTNSMTNFSANVDRNVSMPAPGSELFYRAVTSP